MNTVHTSLITLVCLGTIPARAAEETRFRADEWQVSAFVAYIDKTGSDDWGGGGSVSYFLTKNFGLGGTTYWSNVDGLLIDNLAAEGTYRLPLLNWPRPMRLAASAASSRATSGSQPWARALTSVPSTTSPSSVTLSGALPMRPRMGSS